MLNSVLGIKIGMTQFFNKEGKVVPATAINVGNWFVIQIKTEDVDGYNALQLGLPRLKNRKKSFSADWLKRRKKNFIFLREIAVDKDVVGKFKIGQEIKPTDIALEEGTKISVFGKSKGLGFQGVVRRWNFAGGPKSHGSTFHRKPGSIGNLCKEGSVVKGKKMPGHMGAKRITVQGLKIAKWDKNLSVLFVKGATPGKKNTLLCISKQG